MCEKDIGDELNFTLEERVSGSRYSYKDITGIIKDLGTVTLDSGDEVDFFIVDPQAKHLYYWRGVIDAPKFGLFSPVMERYEPNYPDQTE